ncbi:hypothetical protein [Bartonella acomydis]|uniref:Uncharacterized protein n=1 Tax=Bartonella acomydis TaxID=686234 RepID=A0ABP9MPW4_9HYPH
MIRIFRKYTCNTFIAAAFFLSQIVNVHANHLTDISQKEVTDYVMEYVKDTTSKIAGTSASYIPAVSYRTINETALEGKVEKVLEPMTIGIGFLAAGYVASFITSIIGWIKDLVIIFK